MSSDFDLDAVKAMLRAALHTSTDDAFHDDPDDCGFGIDGYVDIDKLAATVMEFFAGREAAAEPQSATTFAIEITSDIDLERGVATFITTDSVSNVVRIDRRPFPSWWQDGPEGSE